jgi:hypothetical protein
MTPDKDAPDNDAPDKDAGDDATYEIECTTCHGHGAHPPLLRNDCEDCGGVGVLAHPRDPDSSPRSDDDMDEEDEQRPPT